MNAITTPPAPTPREAARQRAIDKMNAECDRLIARGMRLAALAELMYRRAIRKTTKEHVHADR